LGILTTYQQILTQHVLFYSTDTVFLQIERGQKRSGVAFYDVTFSGYLVKAP
jgi:hypothetical protein